MLSAAVSYKLQLSVMFIANDSDSKAWQTGCSPFIFPRVYIMYLLIVSSEKAYLLTRDAAL